MKVLYIAPYNVGSTSRMRGEHLKDLIQAKDFKIIDLDVPLSETNRIFRSLGWRYKYGPLIWNINAYISGILNGDYEYDLVWVDKGVFIYPEIIEQLRKRSKKLVHFTPDPAFTYHRSHLFYKALPFYDYCVTTKSFELENYRRFGVKTIFCTQGYDPAVHKPLHNFDQKRGVVFIGHREEEREYLIAKLLEAKIQVTLAGNKWGKFASRFRGNSELSYKGPGLYGEHYTKEISGAFMGLGFLSKWIPEKHTTRTLEIPACRTALVTERNNEIADIYKDDDAIFYEDHNDMIEKVKFYMANKSRLHWVTENGHKKVIDGSYTYRGILANVIKEI